MQGEQVWEEEEESCFPSLALGLIPGLPLNPICPTQGDGALQALQLALAVLEGCCSSLPLCALAGCPGVSWGSRRQWAGW